MQDGRQIFGPVVVVSSFKDDAEVLECANATEFGLSGAVFSQDVNQALRVAGQIQSGTVCINCCTMVDIQAPFGGYKQSVWGRELGKAGIQAYTETKTAFMNMTY
ncbi:hypothetical protein MAP00_005353 [Monascus purpureus]|nr:hypothetical protein MAP00_005353 [Monascus purpureus]